MHIGLIGGIGPAATEFYYRGLIDRHAVSGTTLDLTIVHADAREMVRNLANRDAARQVKVFATLVERLAAAGARTAAVTSMSGHFCIDELSALVPLPLLNALPEVGAEIKCRGLKTVGLIGTRMVMESRLYGSLAPYHVILPEGDEFEDVQQHFPHHFEMIVETLQLRFAEERRAAGLDTGLLQSPEAADQVAVVHSGKEKRGSASRVSVSYQL